MLLPGKSHGRRNLVGCSPWGPWGSDTTEWLHFHFSLSCIGEGNGNPFQCSCMENSKDREAWWALVYGVAQSWTLLKWLSSSKRDFDLSIIVMKYWCYFPIFQASSNQKHWKNKNWWIASLWKQEQQNNCQVTFGCQKEKSIAWVA